MRIRLKERLPHDIEFGIMYGGIAVLALMALRFTPVAHMLPGCVFKGLTSIPCTTCGATRSLLLLVNGEWAASLSMNPLVALCAAGACLVFPYSLVARLLYLPRPAVTLSARERVVAQVAAVALVLLNWSYLAGAP